MRLEIARLRLEQQKLRRAESALAGYHASIERTRQDIARIEARKADIIRAQDERRKEIVAAIEKEKTAMNEARLKIEEKKNQIAAVCHAKAASVGLVVWNVVCVCDAMG